MSAPFRPPVPEPLHEESWANYGKDRPAGNHEFRVTQGFDDVDPVYPTVKHRALDLGNARLGDPVSAPASGVVVAEGFLREPWSQSTTKYGTGNYGGIMAAIRHDNGYTSGLAHLRDTVVSAGQRVTQGQVIGHLGDTGAAKGRGGHVHWDVYHGFPTTWTEREAMLVDPWPLLEQNWVEIPDTSVTSPEDDSMLRFGGSALSVERAVPRYKLIVGANFRAEPSTKSAILQADPKGMPAGTVVPVAYWVDGESLNGDDQWALAFLYVDQYRPGFFHRSVLGAPDAAAADCTEAVKQATAPLSAEITRLGKRITDKDAYIANYPKG